ncbi:Plasma membrane ferric chelate reductase Fre2 [Neofusicoccum parvum]|nr:Plasma membrane ferric chelate reductase Fre2 [Neofusicoccum parvum]
MTLLLIVSTPVWLRERYYELFIDSHIVSSLAVIIGLFVHTSVFDHEYDWYLWVPAILWLLDRSLRLIRILAFNFGFRRGRIQCTKTTAIYDRESNIITLEIVPGPNIAPPKPGQYYFLYQPFSIRGYENHPMTLGTWRRHSNVSSASEEEVYPLTPTTTSSAEQEEDGETAALSSSSQPLLSSAASSASSSVTNLATPSSPTSPSKSSAKTPTTLTFWIRPYDGWTRRLRDQCIRHDAQAHPNSGRTRTRTARLHPLVLLEGPYGATHALGSYDATILIAGGSGISAAVPYLQEEHAKQQRASPGGEEDVEEGGGSDGAGRARMQLVWAAREEAFMREVVERELAAGLAQGAFGAALFCTGDAARAERVGGVEIQAGRPNVRAVIGEAAQGVVAAKARARPGKRGRIAVLLCGPPAMARGVEAAVRSAAEEFDCWVDYFDEVFSW